eukprot:GFUD01002352.1.p2 GENE.GFUD01002352.1~~GFUD01002352.1.p2  ORF type:complete len:105 (-),score=46.39 GFUD01002352.1:121-435(-)
MELSRIDKSVDDKHKKRREEQGQRKEKINQKQQKLDSSNEKEAGKNSRVEKITHKKNTDYVKDVPGKEDEGKKRGKDKSYKRGEHSSREDKFTGGEEYSGNVKV